MNKVETFHPNAVQAFTTLEQFLHENQWRPQRVDAQYMYRLIYSERNEQFTCYAQIRLEVEQFAFYVIAPLQTPESARPVMAEFLTRVNYGLWIGNFEMDWKDGEVRYKSSLDFEGVPLTPQLIRNAIQPAVRTMSCYLPGLTNIAREGKSPAEAFAALIQSLSECEHCP